MCEPALDLCNLTSDLCNFFSSVLLPELTTGQEFTLSVIIFAI